MMKKTKKLSVSIGIPAHNEENNIQNLLNNLLKQRQTNFVIQEIIVVDDASHDQTVQKIKSLNNKKIRLIKNKIRYGQVFCQNLIFSRSSTDIVVILEADTFPKGKSYLKSLVKPIVKDNSVALVQGNAQPLTSETLIGKIIRNQSLIYKHFSFKYHYPYADIFSSGRGGRAFSKILYKKLRWPMSVPEDIYSTLWAKENGYKVVFSEKVICQYKCPQTLEDFLKERQKSHNAYKKLLNYFNNNSIRKIYKRSLIDQIFMSILFLINSPLHYIYYIFLKIYSYLKIVRHDFSDDWIITSSTKNLFNKGLSYKK